MHTYFSFGRTNPFCYSHPYVGTISVNVVCGKIRKAHWGWTASGAVVLSHHRWCCLCCCQSASVVLNFFFFSFCNFVFNQVTALYGAPQRSKQKMYRGSVCWVKKSWAKQTSKAPDEMLEPCSVVRTILSKINLAYPLNSLRAGVPYVLEN